MSCVVGLVDRRDIWMGADSAVTYPDGRIANLGAEKAFIVGKWAVGLVGSCRLETFLKHEVPWPNRTGTPEARVAKQVAAIHKAAKAADLLVADEKAPSLPYYLPGQLLIGHAGTLWTVGIEFSILPALDGYAAIGCGESEALVSLSNTAPIEGQDPPEAAARIQYALSDAANRNAFVRPPFVVVKLDGKGRGASARFHKK